MLGIEGAAGSGAEGLRLRAERDRCRKAPVSAFRRSGQSKFGQQPRCRHIPGESEDTGDAAVKAKISQGRVLIRNWHRTRAFHAQVMQAMVG